VCIGVSCLFVLFVCSCLLTVAGARDVLFYFRERGAGGTVAAPNLFCAQVV
jgi:hypothetical protein